MVKGYLLSNKVKRKMSFFTICLFVFISVLNGQTIVSKPMQRNMVKPNPYMSVRGSIHNDSYSSDVRDDVMPYILSEVRYSSETDHEQNHSPATIFFDSKGRAVSSYAPGVAIRDFSGDQINTINSFVPDEDFNLLMAYAYVDNEDRVVAPTSHGHIMIVDISESSGANIILDVDVLGIAKETHYQNEETYPSLLGITCDYSGNIWFSTGGFRIDPDTYKAIGFIGYISKKYIDENTGETPKADTDIFFYLLEKGEGAENGISANETGTVILTNEACYMFQADASGISKKWETKYQSDGAKNARETDRVLGADGEFTNDKQTGGGLAYGSGTTPTLTSDMVIFTDNREKVHLLALDISSGALIAETPILSDIKGRVSVENSIIVYSPSGDLTSVIVCNWFGAGNPAMAAPDFDPASYSYDALYDPNWVSEGDVRLYPGVERIDIKNNNAEVVWTRDDLRGTAIMTLSTATGYLYTYAQDLSNGDWYYCVLDYETGNTVSKTYTGNGSEYNNMAVGMFADPNGNALYCPNNNKETMCLWDQFAGTQLPAAIDFGQSSRKRLAEDEFAHIGNDSQCASYLYTLSLEGMTGEIPVNVYLNGLSGKKRNLVLYMKEGNDEGFTVEEDWTLWDMDTALSGNNILAPETNYTLQFTPATEVTSITFILGLKEGEVEEDEYEIDSVEGLVRLADEVNKGRNSFEGKSISLTADIDLSECEGGWEPIGISMYPFKGSFSGNGYTISNLKIDTTAIHDDAFGLFGYIKDAVIDSLVVENADINIKLSVENYDYHSYIGFIAGDAQNSTISNCYTQGKYDHSEKSRFNKVGGIVGKLRGSDIKNCYTHCELKTSMFVGGLVGDVAKGSDPSLIENSYSTGVIEKIDEGGSGGGIAGCNYTGLINACVGILSETCYGKICGYNEGKVTNCLAFDKMGMVVNRTDGGNPTYVDGENTSLTKLRQQTTYEAIGWDFTETWEIWENKSFPYLSYQSAPAAGVVATTEGMVYFELRNDADSVIINTTDESYSLKEVPAGRKEFSLKSGLLTKSTTLEGDVEIIIYEKDKAPSPTVKTTALTPVTLSEVQIADKTYDGTTDAVIANRDGLTLEGVDKAHKVSLNKDKLSFSFDNKNVGDDKPVFMVTNEELLEGDDAGSYVVLYPPENKASIAQATLTITANNDRVTVGFDPALYVGSYSISGFVPGEDESVLTSAPKVTLAEDITSSTPTGTYPEKILVGEAAADNYTIEHIHGTLTIRPVYTPDPDPEPDPDPDPDPNPDPNPTGIEEVTNPDEGTRLYPNPTQGIVNIDISQANGTSGEMTVYIYTITGQLKIVRKISVGISQIDMSYLPAGFYVAKIGNETIKIIKQ